MHAEVERLSNREDLKVRSRQKAAILKEIYLMPEPSRRAIVKSLGIRSSTISALIDELIESKAIQETGRQTNERGRPRLNLALGSNSRIILSIYAEHFQLIGGLVNLEEQVISEAVIPIPKETTSAEFIQIFDNMIEQLLALVPENAKLVGVAFSPLGTVNASNNQWSKVSRWPNIEKVDFNYITEKYGLPVKLRRNIETILDYEIQTTREFWNKDIALFHWGYGVGSSFASKGQVIDTERGNYTGIGHTLVNPDSSQKCHCGALGCLESEAAIWSLLPQYAQIDPRVLQDVDKTYEILADAFSEKYPFFKEAMNAIKIGLYNLCKIYSPDYVLFLSPFARNSNIVATLKRTTETSFPKATNFEPEFRVIDGDYRGALYANVYPFIRDELLEIIG